MGVPFIISSADVDEHLSGKPQDVVMQLAKRKALAVSNQYPEDDILAADTLVHCSGAQNAFRQYALCIYRSVFAE